MTALTSVASVALASLLGSLHCVGMCGGLVSFYAATGAPRSAQMRSHAAYHLTRLAAYTTLGAVAGQLGAGLDLAGGRVGLSGLGAWGAALSLIVVGAMGLLRQKSGARLLSLGRNATARSGRWRRLESFFATLAQRARVRPPLWRASLLGLSSALLPCGWLYAFVLLAAGAGSWSRGALLLAAFWSGTVPALLGLGVGIERASRSLRARVPRLSAALLVSIGLFTLASRWPLAGARAESGAAAAPPSCHDSR